MASPYDLYVFDLDGTLVDSLPDIADALNDAFVARGLGTHPISAYRGFLGDGARELVQRALEANQANDADVDAIVDDYRVRYAQHLVRSTRVYPGMLELLHRVPKAAVLTNKRGIEARSIVRELGLERHFVEVVGEHDGYPRKPDPAGLQALATKHSTHRTLYIGDSLIDARTAAAAGIDFLFARWGYGQAPIGVRCADHAHDIA